MALEEVGCQRPLAWWQHLYELIVDLVGIFGARQAQSLGDTEHVRVDRDRLLPERVPEDHVRCLEAHAGELPQGFAKPWHLTAVLVDEGYGNLGLTVSQNRSRRSDRGAHPKQEAR